MCDEWFGKLKIKKIKNDFNKTNKHWKQTNIKVDIYINAYKN